MTIFHRSAVPCMDGGLRRIFKTTGLMKVLGGLLAFAAFGLAAQAMSINLAWNQSTDPIVTGYNLYYGGASGNYTNKISAGNATGVTVSGLLPGATYYFAATDYGSAGVESPLSGEVSYTVPPPTRAMQYRVISGGQKVLTLTGPVGHSYSIMATQDFKTWTLIGTVTIGAAGTLDFTDTNSASFSRRFYRTSG